MPHSSYANLDLVEDHTWEQLRDGVENRLECPAGFFGGYHVHF